MLFFTLVDGKVFKGIPIFGEKLGSSDFPLATVSLTEGQFPKVLPSPFDNRECFSLNKTKPDGFIDQGYFYQFNGNDHCGRTSRLLPIIIADQPYYANRTIAMIVLKKGQTIDHEHGIYPIWECSLPLEIKKYSYLKLFAIERDRGWITIKQGRNKTSYHCYGYKFDVSKF